MQPQRPSAPLDDPVPEPRLTVAAAARRLGIAPATLRTWDRRYGIGPQEHAPGSHRRYSPVDLARLELMHHALIRGASPAEAARYALASRLPAEEESLDAGAGGSVVRLPAAGRRARGLSRAVLALDSVAARDVLSESIGASGVEATWEEVARPVFAAIAERYAATGAGIEIEHLLSDCVAVVFGAHPLAAPAARDTRPVLLAGMPQEHHALPLVVLAAALADERVACRSMGANLPAAALDSAIRRTAPSVVVLWAQVPGTADLEVVSGLPRTRSRFRTFVAGPGWADVRLPSGVIWLESLAGAGTAITAVAAVRPR